MLCDECQKKAACVHITTIIGDKKIEKHLCEICAQKSGELNITQKLHNLFNAKAVENLHDFIKEIIGGSDKEETQNTRRCPECGLTQFEFSKNGKFGCSACYAAFAEDLEALLQKIHGAIEQKGKIAYRSLAMMGVNEKIEALRLKIKTHIAQEEYEEAAAIRDEIRSLEAKLLAEEELASKGEL
ncbi:MAG: UvrB/UvrC motif-containing protein [Sporomusaceae bacterium]|jgi:protein arginine kinase activator|nr:UvrB/UvrC motif-containing protein [Sporomusaceae bacterium]